MAVDKGFAVVGIKFSGKSTAQDGFLESVVKGFGVGLRIISREGDQAGVIIDQDTELSAQGFAVD